MTASTPSTPASNDSVLVQKIEAEARRYAGHYPEASDGRNTFVMFADWVSSLAAAPASPEPASNEAPGRGGTSGNVTLYREIDALGGYHDPEDQRDVGYGEALTAVLAILQRRGFSEHVEAVPAPIVGGTSACPICGEDKPHHHTAKVVDAYQHKGSRA